MIKLNGGLATTMGLRSPSRCVEARDGARSWTSSSARRWRCAGDGVRLPLVLMDSEATRDETLAALAEHPELAGDGAAARLHAEHDPQARRRDARAGELARPAPALEWCPPGHGDIYGALRRSGMLATLLEQGFRYAMISNSDNLGATLDPRIAALRRRARRSRS